MQRVATEVEQQAASIPNIDDRQSRKTLSFHSVNKRAGCKAAEDTTHCGQLVTHEVMYLGAIVKSSDLVVLEKKE